MKNSGTYDIDQTVNALEQAIEKRKIQMQNTRPPLAVSPLVSHVFSEVLNRAGGSYGQVNQLLEHGREFAQNFIKKTQQNLEERPWDVLRKVAVYSFSIGLFLSLRHRQSPTEEKE